MGLKPVLASIIGRKNELEQLQACLKAQKNVLLEGPVGVGKTHLAVAVAESLGRPVIRIDGDGRYTEQKLTGWFDPPAVLKNGYTIKSFIPGPLTQAMQEGGVLLINELNRLPEGVQNVLLPAVDERMIQLPYLEALQAHADFRVIATQNPKEFVATHHLSEALLDRFELVVLDYQTEAEENQIVCDRPGVERELGLLSVQLIRNTRQEQRIRRGASIRAAISVAEIAGALLQSGQSREQAFCSAAVMALPNRIEIERDALTDLDESQTVQALILELSQAVLSGTPVKKKP